MLDLLIDSIVGAAVQAKLLACAVPRSIRASFIHNPLSQTFLSSDFSLVVS
jgi:hypothetical protein